MSDYYELLKHPKWQQKRLEVLERENFTCEYCGSTEKELHVHHTYYEKGRKPWEYEDVFLKCVCKKCHEYIKSIEDKFKFVVGFLSAEQMEQIIGYMKGYLSDKELGNQDFLKISKDSYPEFSIMEGWEEIVGFLDFNHSKKYKDLENIAIKNGSVSLEEAIEIIEKENKIK